MRIRLKPEHWELSYWATLYLIAIGLGLAGHRILPEDSYWLFIGLLIGFVCVMVFVSFALAKVWPMGD